MGVPKFYRWISERYPCLSEVVKEYQIPEFDNLYLDMNGIIHICSHPDDDDPHFRISEENIFKQIFHYIEVLFRMIQPTKVFYMAVDGVAPRAKMNQQRGRRFRTAREAEENERKALEKGEILPTEARFDSNCITPGTAFMTKLDAQLQYFVTSKVTCDKLWQNCTIVYSGHKTPGEGEHKIMEYIRYARSQPNYDPNTRHCLYGLDADLMMLGLTSHEPHFSLLREEVRFHGKKSSSKRFSTPEETTFHLLHLSLMREYIDYEFYSLRDALSFKYDLEAIIDDWVLMGFLVGNDFIPHLPGLHINQDALIVLYQTYKSVMPTLDGYLNEGGKLNLKRLERFMARLTEYDIEKFHEVNADLKYLQGKRGEITQANEKVKEMKFFEFDDGFNDSEFGMLEEDNFTLSSYEVKERLARLDIHQDEDFLGDDTSCDDEEALFNEEFRQHKRDYYRTKMLFEEITPQMLCDQATQYVRGLQWILHYYYNGICSWSWYYPHHYAPYISDVKDFADTDLSFEKETPFLPFEQLLAVLPPLSVKLLPKPYRKLMLDDSSPLKQFYPRAFTTDLNGKQQDWEAVVCIPFINEKLLLGTMKKCNEELSTEEKERNSHGPMYIYRYTRNSSGQYEAPEYFPPIGVNHADVKLVWRRDWDIDPSRLIKGLLPGVKLNLHFAGFPTLRHLQHTFRKEKASLRIFQQDCKGESFILEVTAHETPPMKELIQNVLGHTVYFWWPHLVEVKVTSLNFKRQRFYIRGSDPTPRHEEIDATEQKFWKTTKEDLERRLMRRWGIDMGETECIVFGKQMCGRDYVFGSDGSMTLEKKWSETEVYFPLQAIVRNIEFHDFKVTNFSSVESYFTSGTRVFMLGQPHYGTMGHVTIVTHLSKPRVGVSFLLREDPDLTPAMNAQQRNTDRYFSANESAVKLGISAHLFARLTGSVFLAKAHELNPFVERESATGRINIGLNLKSNKRSEEVVGFTRKGDGFKHWLYSEQCLKSVKEYLSIFPEVFEFFNQNSSNDAFEDELFPNNYKERVPALTKWLKDSPFSSAERAKWGSECLGASVVAEIIKEVQRAKGLPVETVNMYVQPCLLYKPKNRLQGSAPPDPKVKFKLLDRVVNVREGFSVPLGALGTIIGIQPAEQAPDIMYIVLFDEPFSGGLTIAGEGSVNRCYRLSWTSMINISFGRRSSCLTSSSTPYRSQNQGISSHNAALREMQRWEGPNANKVNKSPVPSSVTQGAVIGPSFEGNSLTEKKESPQPPKPDLLPKPKPLFGYKGVQDITEDEKSVTQSNRAPLLHAQSLDAPGISVGRGRGRTAPFETIWSQLKERSGCSGSPLEPSYLSQQSNLRDNAIQVPSLLNDPPLSEKTCAAPTMPITPQNEVRKEVSVNELFSLHKASFLSDSCKSGIEKNNHAQRHFPHYTNPHHQFPNFSEQHTHFPHQSQHSNHNRPQIFQNQIRLNSSSQYRLRPFNPSSHPVGNVDHKPRGQPYPYLRSYSSSSESAYQKDSGYHPDQDYTRFIPTQVARRHTSRKSCSEDNPSCAPKQPHLKSSHIQVSAAQNESFNSPNERKVPTPSDKPKKQKKSRIAAKFATAQDLEYQEKG